MGCLSMNKLIAFDEPHSSGGNCHVTMTKEQAIAWIKKIYKAAKRADISNGQALEEFIVVNWAYWE